MKKLHDEMFVSSVIADAINNDLTTREAAEKHEIGYQTLYNWCKKLGVKLKPAAPGLEAYDWKEIQNEIREKTDHGR